MLVGLCCPWSLQGRVLSFLSASSVCWLSWPPLACRHIPPVSASIITWGSPVGICVSVHPLQLERHQPLGWYHGCSMHSSEPDSAKNLFPSKLPATGTKDEDSACLGGHNSIHSSISAVPNVRVRNEGSSSWGLSYLMRAYLSLFLPSWQHPLCVLSSISCCTSTGDSTQPRLKCLNREIIWNSDLDKTSAVGSRIKKKIIFLCHVSMHHNGDENIVYFK